MKRLYRLVSSVLALVLVAMLVIPVQTPVSAQEDEDEDDLNIRRSTVEEIIQDPEDFIFDRVAVLTQVGDLLTPRAFTVVSDEEFGSVLVIGPLDVIPPDLDDEAIIRVTGTVTVFDPEEELEPFLEDIDIDPEREVYAEFANEAVIVADAVEIIAERDVERVEPAPPVNWTTLEELTDEPERFIGDEVVLISGQINDILTPQAIVLGDDEADGLDDELLVLAPRGEITDRMSEDAIVRVTGIVQIFDPQDEFAVAGRELGIDTGDEAFSDFEDGPVIVADSVELLVPALGQTVAEILDDPDAFTGEVVPVIGEVRDVLAAEAFTLKGRSGFLGLTEENLLVIGAEDDLEDIAEDAIIRVTGVVRFFDPGDVFEVGGEEIEFGGADDVAEFEDEPVIVAESVEVLATEPGETIENILDQPDRYIGDTVTVAGKIEEVIDFQAFTLQGTEGFIGLSNENLLVVAPPKVVAETPLDEDVIAVVRGEVRIFASEVFEDLDIGIDPGDMVFDEDEFDGEPVIIATSIAPIAAE